MKISKKILIAAVPALAIANLAFAQDAAAVNQPANPATEAVPAESSGTTKITIEVPKINLPKVDDIEITPTAMVQVQYAYTTNSHKAANAKDRNGFAIRRTTLGASAKMKDGWSMKLVYEFDSKGTAGDNWNRYIDTAIISKKFDAGTLTVGHKKSHFGLEEYSPSSQFLCLERSLNSNFLNGVYAKGLSGYHCGVEWAGKIDGGFEYGIGLSNAVAKDYDTKSNDMAITYWLGQTFKLADKESLTIAMNGTVNFGNEDAVVGNKDIQSNAGTVYGFEPYIQYKNGGFQTYLDFFYVNGSTDSANIWSNGERVKKSVSDFYGINFTAAYLLDCGIEPSFRVTYLHTNSGLVTASTQNRVPEQAANDKNDMAYTFYAGANYYFNKHVKLALGYEYGHLYGGASTHDYGALRSMLQMRF